MPNNIIKLLLLAIICVCIIVLPHTVIAQADKIYENNNSAVVVIITYDKDNKPIAQGSGFIVRSDGAIVTNFHVINKAVSIKVKIAKDKYLEVEGILHSDEANDLVILKAKGENLPVVTLGDSDKIKPGESIYVIGSPLGLENSVTDGIISGIREINQGKKLIQISAPVSPGNSGGPVFNKKGEVIGVATAVLKEAQNINFAMPINIIKNEISKKNVVSLEKTLPEDYFATASYWFLRGAYLFQSAKYQDAIEAFKEAIRIEPDFAEAYLAYACLGTSYNELGDYQKAIEAFKEAIRIKPNYANAHFGLGTVYGTLEDYKKAIESYKEAIRIKPNHADAHFCLGTVYGKLEDYKKAIESYKEAIRIKPNSANAHFCLGVFYGFTGNNKDAKESLKQAIRIKPDLAAAHLALGLTYLILGDRSSALEEYKILKDWDKEMANNLFNAIYEEKK